MLQPHEFTDKYSHEVTNIAYSASLTDGCVRCKMININNGKWDLIELKNINLEQITLYFQSTKGKKYDIRGVLGLLLLLPENKQKYFCSEWCFNAITGTSEGWRFSLNQLAIIFKNKFN